MELDHFSHDHPLMLDTEHKGDEGGKLFCYGCEQPILGSSYGCKRCLFFLHKSCGELPREMTHPSHPHHPLTLLPNPPSHYSKGGCDVCQEECNRFIYHCAPCKFDIDIKCALVVLSIQDSIQHPTHPHPLVPLQKPSIFMCDACGEEHRGSSYLCTTCGFWIHQKCAELPFTIKLNCHEHTLSLVHWSPYPYDRICDGCGEKIYRRQWVYYCSECGHCIAHVNCATEEYSRDLELNPVEPDSGLLGTTTSDAELFKICLPLRDETIDIMTQLIMGMDGKYKEATEIKHACHEHPLTFSDKKTYHDSCSTSNLAYLNEAKHDDKCNGCALSISAPFYYCVQCNFFLHEWCAQLPNELQHPGHPEHSLRLTSNVFVLTPCECCKLHCNGFVFTCFKCGFTLDSKCAFLPRVIKHDAHNDSLALRRMSSGSCTACNASLRVAFECQGCKFNLCVRCALLPRIVRHRYDEHPFILTYSPPANGTVDDVCEICEEGIDFNHWFYHCKKCDQHLHTKCIIPVDEFSNIKYGDSNNIEHHPADSVVLGIGTSNFMPSRYCNAIKKAEDLYPILKSLPIFDNLVDPIVQIVKDLRLLGKFNEVTEIKHDSHEHTLIKHMNDELNRKISNPFRSLQNLGNPKRCNGCTQTITAPFYRCDKCNYSLHQWCAELPKEMRHPCHPKHPLLFTANSDPYKCQCCNSLCIAFGFRCSTCEFSLDSWCASLPRIIRHDAHKHTLALNLRWPRNCCACDGSFFRFAYVCSPCNYKLCIGCALLPHTIRHGSGNHRFTLTYPPLKDQEGKYDCGSCEKEINPRFWFYTSDNGEKSLHTTCVRSGWYPNSNKLALTAGIDDHPHLLLSVKNPHGSDNCSYCGQSKSENQLFVYDCSVCRFWMHDHCVRALLFGKTNR